MGAAARARGLPCGTRLRGESLRRARSEHRADGGRSRPHTRSLLARAERQLDEQRATLSHDERKALTRDLERIEGWFDERLQPRRRPRRRGVRGGARRPLSAAAAAVAGRGRGPDRAAALPRAARSPRRTRGRRGRRVRRSRARRCLSAPRRPADPARGRDRGRPRPPRPGRLVAVALRAAHRDDRRPTSTRRRRRARSLRSRAPRRSQSCSPGRRRHAPASKRCSRRRHVPRSSAGWRPRRTSTRRGCSRRRGRCSTSGGPAREEELLARWREEAARNGRAATGWEETLQAASDGRVELLLVQDGADRRPTSVPSAAARRRLTGAVRSTGRPSRRPTPASISPSTRR